jgi:hypothetical protein
LTARAWQSRLPAVHELSIVVPAFNEASRLIEGVGRLSEAIDQGAVDPETTEIIVVDDGSTDDTAATALDVLAKFPHHRLVRRHGNRGKGAAVRAGVAEATGAVIAYMDADMAIHPQQLPGLLEALEDADVAIGSRALGGHGVVYATRMRTLQGRIFNLAVNSLTKVGLGDTQCGFKAFRAPAARLLFGSTVIDRFAFDMELLALARQFDLRIAEVAVHWSDVPDSRIRPLRDPASMLFDLVASRAGLHRPQPIAALSLTPADPHAVFAALDDPTVPVLPWGDDGALVLFPLRPGDVDRTSDLLAAAVPTASVRRLTVEVRWLREEAPLHLVPAAVPAGHPRSVALGGVEPVGSGDSRPLHRHSPAARPQTHS